MSALENAEVRLTVNAEDVERAIARINEQTNLLLASVEAAKYVQRALRWQIILGIAASAMWLGASIAMFCMKHVN